MRIVPNETMISSNYGFLTGRTEKAGGSLTAQPQERNPDKKDNGNNSSLSKAPLDAYIFKTMTEANRYYLTDGTVRQVVDRYGEGYGDVYLKSDNSKAKQYVESRLELMSLASGEPWKIVLHRAFDEVWRLGNAVIAFKRGGDLPTVRTLYADRPLPIVGLELVSPLSLDVVKVNGYIGFKRRDGKTTNLETNPRQPANSYKIEKLDAKFDSTTYVNGLDCCHLYFKKLAGATWGWGLTFSALEAMNVHRGLETTVAMAHQRFQAPIIHLQVTRPSAPRMNFEMEIAKSANTINSADPNSIYISGPNQEFKVHGSESQLLRSEGVLNQTSRRMFSGLATTPFEQGFEGGTLGSAQSAVSLTASKKLRVNKELSMLIEHHLINQLLFEGGFNPIDNPQDRVAVILTDAYEGDIIKRRAAAADLYVKGYCDLLEARELGSIKGVPDPALMYVSLVDIKKIQAKLMAPSTVNKDFIVNTSEDIKEMLLYIKAAGYNFSEQEFTQLEEHCNALLPDREAVNAFVREILHGKD